MLQESNRQDKMVNDFAKRFQPMILYLSPKILFHSYLIIFSHAHLVTLGCFLGHLDVLLNVYTQIN